MNSPKLKTREHLLPGGYETRTTHRDDIINIDKINIYVKKKSIDFNFFI